MKQTILCLLLTAAILLGGCAAANSVSSNSHTKIGNVAATPAESPDAQTESTAKYPNLPQFPFPPNATAAVEIDRTLLKNANGETTFGKVKEKLRNALRKNGYQNIGYYSVQSEKGGFVITTAVETVSRRQQTAAG